MSIPKEKTILIKIKEIVDTKYVASSTKVRQIKKLVDSYQDPGYIGGPVVAEAEERKPWQYTRKGFLGEKLKEERKNDQLSKAQGKEQIII
jgi:hypothetical protein